MIKVDITDPRATAKTLVAVFAGASIVGIIIAAVSIHDMNGEVAAQRREISDLRIKLESLQISQSFMRPATIPMAPAAPTPAAAPPVQQAPATPAAAAGDQTPLNTDGTFTFQMLKPGASARPPLPLAAIEPEARKNAKAAIPEPKLQPSSAPKIDQSDNGKVVLLDTTKASPQTTLGVHVQLMKE